MAISRAEVVDYLANMTVLDLSTLIKELEEKFGVSAAVPMAMAAAGPMAAEAAPVAEEQTEFDVVLTVCGHQGNPRRHEPGAERGQGSGGECAHHSERSGFQGGSRRSQEEGGSSGSYRRNQVGPAGNIWSRVVRAKKLTGQKAGRWFHFSLFASFSSCSISFTPPENGSYPLHAEQSPRLRPYL